jgi:Bacterial membrane protein YfhO
MMPRTLSAPSRVAGIAPVDAPRTFWEARGGIWGAFAVLAAIVPVVGVFTLNRVFYVRDLSLVFWDRNLWLRRSLLSGEWPLWDPYLAAGQSMAADALHQMFLLPVVLVRLIGTEVVGFNLWVALPFPVAALGVYRFLRSRFSPSASALGAITFAVSGPVVSTGNFPNMSWAVAALPWVLWAADRCHGTNLGRRVGVLGLVFASQAAAGEPVTMVATAGLTLAFSLAVGLPDTADDRRARIRRTLAVSGGLALGGLIGAVQLLPLASAVSDSWRPFIRKREAWSFHPLALAETVSLHLFGNYFEAITLDAAPWFRALNSNREPFFYSVYVGPGVLGLALFGALTGWRRAWTGFWSASALVGLIAAFGGYTPIYPVVQSYVPLVGSFRFPAKYLVICVIALAALVACAWDAIALGKRREMAPGRYRAGWYAGVVLPTVIGFGASLLLAAALYLPTPMARWFYEIAVGIGVQYPVDAAAFALHSVGDAMPGVALLSFGVALLMAIAPSRRQEARMARPALFGIVIIDLLYAAWGINPTCDVKLLAAAPWVNAVRAHPESRFYIGGKMAGTINMADPDLAPRDFTFLSGLPPMVARAAAWHQLLMFPAGSGAHEMFSYDLAVLWPRVYEAAHARFAKASPDERERFLSRTAVRYRLLPTAKGAGRPAMSVAGIPGGAVYDFGSDLTRAFVVPEATVVFGQDAQMESMFGASLDAHRTVMLGTHPGPADGTSSAPVEAFARIAHDSANSVVIDAGAGPEGGFLVVLDSYSPDWRVIVDGRPGTVYSANLLFRAVRLGPGRHTVEFSYRPRMLALGAAISLFGLLGAAVVALRVGRGRQRDVRPSANAGLGPNVSRNSTRPATPRAPP